jgi:hyperosmotically inducible periplasmic protein
LVKAGRLFRIDDKAETSLIILMDDARGGIKRRKLRTISRRETSQTNKTMKLKTILSACAVAALVAGCAKNTDQSNTETTSNAGATSNQINYGSGAVVSAASNALDNTKINIRDRDNSNLTPLNQGNSKADTMLTASIRKMVESSTNNFSTDAKNVKIIVQNGKVTLRGPVNTDAEKTQIESIAKGVAGDGNVQDNLEVKANQ